MGKRIGIYGGTFDPIHIGHLSLATEIMEAHHLDEVWFCPAACNPLKKDQVLGSSDHRLNMIRLAIEEQPRFRISEIEINRKGISYTIDTIKELLALQEGKEDPDTFALILGEDTASDFYKWHQPEEIIDLVSLLIGKRANREKPGESFEAEHFQGSLNMMNAINQGLTQTRMMEVSSKEIRQRLLNKKYCYHLVPSKVMDYIITNHLYYPALNEARFL